MVETVICPYNLSHSIDVSTNKTRTEVTCPICNKKVGVVIGQFEGVDEFRDGYLTHTPIRLDVGENSDFHGDTYSKGKLAFGTWHRGDTISLTYRKGKEYPKTIKNHNENVYYELEEHKSSTCNPGCFIATATYGTPFAPEIIILKKFRDKKLKPNYIGSCLVNWYYRISPPIADFIENQESCKSMTRILLRPVINICNHIMKGDGHD